MKKVLIILGILLLAAALPFHSMVTESLTGKTQSIETEKVKEGDVIFQTSQSQQSPLIQVATRSKITHCGIIVMKGGKPYVLETLKTLTVTPLNDFINRGGGKEILAETEQQREHQNQVWTLFGKTLRPGIQV